MRFHKGFDPWGRSSYRIPEYAVVGSSDCGNWPDSPAPSGKVAPELEDFRKVLRANKIRSRIRFTPSGNACMVKRWVVVKRTDFEKAKRLEPPLQGRGVPGGRRSPQSSRGRRDLLAALPANSSSGHPGQPIAASAMPLGGPQSHDQGSTGPSPGLRATISPANPYRALAQLEAMGVFLFSPEFVGLSLW
jgi:hypothetical protein